MNSHLRLKWHFEKLDKYGPWSMELRLDDARFHTTPCALKLVRSVAKFV